MVRLSKASVDDSELKELAKVFKETVNFGLGIHVDEFEQEIVKLLQKEVYVIAVNTGTSALHLSLEALEFPRGSEVLVPSITFVASYSAISASGLVPVSCEVTFPDGHIDVADARKRVTEKTVAIMPVAYAGADFDRVGVYQLSKDFGLRVVEDDAHAFGGANKEGVLFGSTGDIVCFSFDGIKNITCGEGGAIVTSDPKLAHKLRVMRSLGIEKDVELRYKGQRAWEYDVSLQGYRYHMSNINAAIGLAQLKKLSRFKKIRTQLYETYLEEIQVAGISDWLFPTQKIDSNVCFHIFSCLLKEGIQRAHVRNFLSKSGFETGFHYVPNHLHSAYSTKYSLPSAETMGRQLISLPFHPEVRKEDVVQLCQLLKSYFKSL